MLRRKVNRAIIQLIFTLLCVFEKTIVLSYTLPDPTFQVLKPQGLRVSIPDESGLRLFGFHANINKIIGNNEHGQITGTVYSAANGRWTIVDPDVIIRNGDVLHYWTYVQTNDKASYKKNNEKWIYALSSETTTQNSTKYETSAESRLLFEDNFNNFNETLWKREIKMPLDQDNEFCVYHNHRHEKLAQFRDGQLSISPLILEDYYGENITANGKLQLSGCTSTIVLECTRQAFSFNILPPVISARFTTKDYFTFKYGKIEIRAKFPQGDWLYPEMWLEPRYSTYGVNYNSGRILLGLTRGNEDLVNATDSSKIYDTRRLDFGVRVNSFFNGMQEILVSKIKTFGPRWTQDFHVYTTIWTKNHFRYLVDGEMVGKINLDKEKEWINYNSDLYAPFDQEFFITLGVGVGGIRVFPDGILSSRKPKPWKNKEVKAMLKFWKARSQWEPSWKRDNGNNAAFVIDYVKVWSL
ncbi:hypothetical protein PUN28_004397 [Cardiocondyla obscurior]|uniref:Beta-1,3-glucan-binding protein n=1 Tax=Cardiocondyla obscurior TaxID=286306 RepID=A0AAW2GFP8_9HYME